MSRQVLSQGARRWLAAAALLACAEASQPSDYGKRPFSNMIQGRCICQDPLYGQRGKQCYSPVCPSGYYKCCATCGSAQCARKSEMWTSWRGNEECVRCEPGDLCRGCDTFERCPTYTRDGEEFPKITQGGAKTEDDCEACGRGLEADLDKQTCIERYSHACNKEFLERCIDHCSPSDPLMLELNSCDKMKCTMYCANRWRPGCADALKTRCVYLARDRPNISDSGSIAGYVEEEWLGRECDVDCNPAQRLGLALVAAVAATAALL